MKKFLKRLFLLLLASIICVTVIFHKRIYLLYGIASKYISLEKEIDNMNDAFSIEPIENIDYKDITYKNTNGVSLTLDIYSPLKYFMFMVEAGYMEINLFQLHLHLF